DNFAYIHRNADSDADRNKDQHAERYADRYIYYDKDKHAISYRYIYDYTDIYHTINILNIYADIYHNANNNINAYRHFVCDNNKNKYRDAYFYGNTNKYTRGSNINANHSNKPCNKYNSIAGKRCNRAGYNNSYAGAKHRSWHSG